MTVMLNMVFASIGLLVIGGVLLTLGIADRNMALVVGSVAPTVGAGVLVIAAYVSFRRSSRPVAPPPRNRFADAWVPSATPATVIRLPVASAPARTTPLLVAAPLGNGDRHSAPRSPLMGYDDLTAEEITEILDTGSLTVDQLLAMRRHEAQGPARAELLTRIDKALQRARRTP